ncbi:hypothetical protein ACLOJK_030767, partial [Asimina triloba]
MQNLHLQVHRSECTTGAPDSVLHHLRLGWQPWPSGASPANPRSDDRGPTKRRRQRDLSDPTKLPPIPSRCPASSIHDRRDPTPDPARHRHRHRQQPDARASSDGDHGIFSYAGSQHRPSPITAPPSAISPDPAASTHPIHGQQPLAHAASIDRSRPSGSPTHQSTATSHRPASTIILPIQLAPASSSPSSSPSNHGQISTAMIDPPASTHPRSTTDLPSPGLHSTVRLHRPTPASATTETHLRSGSHNASNDPSRHPSQISCQHQRRSPCPDPDPPKQQPSINTHLHLHGPPAIARSVAHG